jgi:hypothetical protein
MKSVGMGMGMEKGKDERWTYRAHQQRFIANEVRFRGSPGRVIDHELGSGKTLTVIGAIEALRQFPEFKEAPVLVLTMKALINGFKGELEKSKHFQDTRVDLYTITTCQRFYLDVSQSQFQIQGGILVIDEAHHLRNAKSKRYRVIFQAAKQVRKTYLMSGTITINYSVDVAPLFNLILSDEKRLKYTTTTTSHSSVQAGYLPVTRHEWEKVFETKEIQQYMRCLVSHHITRVTFLTSIGTQSR